MHHRQASQFGTLTRVDDEKASRHAPAARLKPCEDKISHNLRCKADSVPRLAILKMLTGEIRTSLKRKEPVSRRAFRRLKLRFPERIGSQSPETESEF